MKKQKRYYREEPQPATLPIVSRYANGDYRLVKVFVEGYDDVAFWRGIFDDYETDRDMHAHFYCEQCQRTTCLPEVDIPEIHLPEGYKLSNVNFMPKGICPECAAKQKR